MKEPDDQRPTGSESSDSGAEFLRAFRAWRLRQIRAEGWAGDRDDEFVELVKQGADAVNAHLSGAVHGGSRLRPNLKGADLRGLDLTGAQFNTITFARADLASSNLQGADLRRSCLEHANLENCNLSGASLRGVQLAGAKLAGATLTNTDMRESTGACFDSNDISSVDLHGASFPWLALRQSYSGPMVLLHTLLLVLFFSPFLARGALYLAATRVVQVGQAVADELAEQKGGGVAVDVAERMGLDATTLFGVLMQVDRGPAATVLVALLLVYAVLRLVLVWRVVPMREEEGRTGYTPPLGAYIGLVPWHRVARVLFWVSILSTLWHVADWLAEPVFVASGR